MTDSDAANECPALRVSIFSRAVFFVVLCFLIANPLLLILAGVSKDGGLQAALLRSLLFWLPLESIFVVWVVLDAPVLFGLAGHRVNPFESKSLRLSGLGIVNIASMLLFLTMSNGK